MMKTNCLLKEARLAPKDCEKDCAGCGWNKDEYQHRKELLRNGGLRCGLYLKKRRKEST